MNSDVLSNPKAERIRRVAELERTKTRRKAGRFLAEGPQSVRELVRWRSDAVVDCYVQVGDDGRFMDEAVSAIAEDALAKNLYVHRVTDAVMGRISTDAQGVAAVGGIDAMCCDIDALAEGGVGTASLPVNGPDAGLACTVAAFWQVRDPGNAGTVIRAADAAGCKAVVFVDDCVDRFNPKVIRATAGSLFHIPVLTMGTDEFFAWAHGNGAAVTAADVYGVAGRRPESLSDFAGVFGGDSVEHACARSAVLFGNEARGLPEEILTRVQHIVSIPIYGKAESLNLATSSAVMLYTLAMSRGRHS